MKAQLITPGQKRNMSGERYISCPQSAKEPGLVKMYFAPQRGAERQCHLLLHILNLPTFNSLATLNACLGAE